VHKNALVTMAAAFAFLLPGLAEAQVCAGYASPPGSLAAGANIATPTGGSSIGVEASYDFTNPLGVFAGFNLVRPDGEGVNHSILGVGVSYEVTDYVPIVPAWLSVCPVAAVSLSTVEGTSQLTLPLGMGFATTLPIMPGAIDLIPFAVPQFVATRVSVDNVAPFTDYNFGIGFGALARMGPLYGGVTAGKEFVEAADIDLAVRAGLTFPLR
jgi:hypothetical protein